MKDNLRNIRLLPPSILGNLDKLIVNRIGNTPQSCMLTRDIVGYVSPNTTYRFERDLTLRACSPSAKRARPDTQDTPSHETSAHAVLRGTWISEEATFNPAANILGGMGMLVLQDRQVARIPVITASSENLAFYHARLLAVGDTVTFETQADLPITEVTVGHEYVDHYLVHEQHGGGEYIEHHDEPHLWAPKHPKCGGHILLGIQQQGKFYFTGFRIPFGYAVYLSPHTLHSDAYLVGDYSVVYTVTKAYSTVLFRTESKQLKRLEFVSAAISHA